MIDNSLPSQPLVLSLETATAGGSIFLGRGTIVLATRLGDPKISHSNTLLPDINACLLDAGLTLTEIDLFACASGPGSFTGLRIGLATIKALAATLDRPCSGVSTLAAIAQAADASANTVSLLPAGRGEVFAQHFRVTAEDVIELDTAAHLSPERLLERYGKLRDVVWAGPGAHAQLQLLRDHALKHDIEFSEQPASHGWSLAPLAENLAQHIAALALRNHSRGETERADMLRAFYVRPSDAEINQPWR